ncbi:EKC/KEOPS complex subunit [Fusarium oligoseptatum]|uniref:EKC/KEOPS complex subunit CGI121 n=1 Tax=Fusarium oligoseptatum TaxID=2604345 RepID=A0A428TEF4_9HYPO|nr:EKC/KEOPS complex subunit [Fusarium oligoseptatum]
MSLETVTVEHLPASHKVHVALFRDVRNAAFLHQQLLGRNPDFEYAFIDASVVSSGPIKSVTSARAKSKSGLQLLSAVFKATSAAVNGALRTPNVHSEIVSSMSSSNNIADAYRRYGISPSTKDLIVVKVTFPADNGAEPLTHDQIWEHLKTNVEGEASPVTDEQIATASDVAKVRKYYKLNGLKWLDEIKDDNVRQKEMESLVISAMALRGV